MWCHMLFRCFYLLCFSLAVCLCLFVYFYSYQFGDFPHLVSCVGKSCFDYFFLSFFHSNLANMLAQFFFLVSSQCLVYFLSFTKANWYNRCCVRMSVCVCTVFIRSCVNFTTIQFRFLSVFRVQYFYTHRRSAFGANAMTFQFAFHGHIFSMYRFVWFWVWFGFVQTNCSVSGTSRRGLNKIYDWTNFKLRNWL